MKKKQLNLKQLTKVWYAKLKKSGFVEAEDTNSVNEFMKQWDDYHFRSMHSPEKFQEIQDYYQLATEFLGVHEFNDKQERNIWQLHADGFSIRQTATKLRLQKDKVHKILRRLKKECYGR